MEKETGKTASNQGKKSYSNRKWLQQSKAISGRLKQAPYTVKILDALQKCEIPWLRTKMEIPGRLRNGSVFDEKGHAYCVFIANDDTYRIVEDATGKTERTIRREIDRMVRANIYKDLGFIGLNGGGKARVVASGYWLEGVGGYPKKIRFFKNDASIINAFASTKTIIKASEKPKLKRSKTRSATATVFFEYFELGSRERDGIFLETYRHYLEVYAPEPSKGLSINKPAAKMALHRARVKADRIGASYRDYINSIFDHFHDTKKGEGFPLPEDMADDFKTVHEKWIEVAEGMIMAHYEHRIPRGSDPELRVENYVGTDRQVKYFGKAFDYCKRLAGHAPIHIYLAKFVERKLIPLSFAESEHTGPHGDYPFRFENWSRMDRTEF